MVKGREMMKYIDILTALKEQGARPLDPFDGFARNNGNGYVAIPNTLPLDYLNPIYKKIDTKPIGELTFEGYSWHDKNGEHHIASFDVEIGTSPTDVQEQTALDEIKSKYVTPTLGFDNEHCDPIDLPGEEGVKYLSDQLRNLSLAMSISDAIGNLLDEDLTK